MRRNKVILSQDKVDWLLNNGLDVMDAYPDKLVASDNKAKKALKERLKENLLEGEFVESMIDDVYAVTNLGRCFSGKRVAIMKVFYSNTDIFTMAGKKRILLSEHMGNFDYEETMSKLKELNYPLGKAGYRD